MDTLQLLVSGHDQVPFSCVQREIEGSSFSCMWPLMRLMMRMLQLFTSPYTSSLSPLLPWNSFASHLSSPLPSSPGCSLDDVIHSQDHLSSLTSRDENLALHLKGFCHSQLHHVTHTPTIHVCMWQCTALLNLQKHTGPTSLVPNPPTLVSRNKWSGEQSRISSAYYPKTVKTNEIVRSVIIT